MHPDQEARSNQLKKMLKKDKKTPKKTPPKPSKKKQNVQLFNKIAEGMVKTFQT